MERNDFTALRGSLEVLQGKPGIYSPRLWIAFYSELNPFRSDDQWKNFIHGMILSIGMRSIITLPTLGAPTTSPTKQ